MMKAVDDCLRIQRNIVRALLNGTGDTNRLAVQIQFDRARIGGRKREANRIGQLVGVARLQVAVDIDCSVGATNHDVGIAFGFENHPGIVVILAIHRRRGWSRRRCSRQGRARRGARLRCSHRFVGRGRRHLGSKWVVSCSGRCWLGWRG